MWSEATFERDVQRALERRFAKATVQRIDDVAFSVTPPAPGSAFEVSFHKPRAACRVDWSTCQAEVDRMITAIDEAMQGASARTYAASQLRIALRSRAKLAKATASLTTRPFSDDAQWVLVADLPTTVHLTVTSDDHGMSDDAAWQIAVRNSRPPAFVTAKADAALVLQGDYAPSALLFPAELEAAVREHLGNRNGNLLAVCPEENIVIYTIGGAAEAAALAQVATAGAKESQIPLSAVVMEWTSGAWRPVR